MASKEFNINGKTYVSLHNLGFGATGKVYGCLDEDSTIVAVKCIDLEGKGEKFRQSILSELQIMKKLQPTGKVIKYIDSEDKGDLLYIVMEKGDTDLAKYFEKGKIDRVKRQFYWQEMLAAVKTLHDNKIIHKDLKPHNFVLVQGSLKLIDFGLAKMISTDQSGTFLSQGGAGTMDYISPEVLSGDPSTKVSTRCDVWSLGCMLYYMAYGRTPFGHIPPFQRVTAIIDPKVSIKVPKEDEMDILMYDVLRKCLQRDPKERPTVEELLEHPFLKPNAPMTNLKYALKAMRTSDSDDETSRSDAKIGVQERKTSGPRRKVGHPMILDIDRSKGGSGAMGVSCYSPSNIDPETFIEMEKIGDGSKVVLTITPKEPGVHILKIKLNGKEVQGSPWKFQIDQPEPDNKIPVTKKN